MVVDPINFIKQNMKAQFSVFANVIMITFLFSLISCKKDSPSDPLPLDKVVQLAPVRDIDGNDYQTVAIGAQVWMSSNLKTTKYNDGTAIPLVTADTDWAHLLSPGYCWYNNDTVNKRDYGALYNWYAVNTGKLCPTGWHVPTDAEWTILTTYLGGYGIAGGKLKEIGTIHWNSLNFDTTNETGFSALPGGYRDYFGSFYSIGYVGFWWSSAEFDTASAWYRNMGYYYSNVIRNYYSKQYGFSVRCIKD